MATANIGYAADTALITVTLTSLATGTMRESSVVDNTTNKYLDAMVECTITTAESTGTAGSDKAFYVYFYGGVKASQLTWPCTGTDAALVVGSAGNLVGPYVISVTDNKTTMKTVIPSVALFFSGVLPPWWGCVFYNMASMSIGKEATISYLGITETVA